MKKMNENNNGNIPNNTPNNSGDSLNNIKVFPNANGAYMIPTTDYSQILDSYQHIAKKERSIQIFGSIFAFLSGIIELIVFLLVKPLLNYHIPLGVIAQFIWIFLVLFIIIVITLAQLIIIFRWNRNVEKVKQKRQTLTMTNYNMINQIARIIFTIIAILILNMVFFWFYSRYSVPPRPDRLIVFLRIYTALRRLTLLLIFSYTIFEILQLIKWIKRNNKIKKIEQKIFEDLPKLQELVDITKTYVATGPFDSENEEEEEEDDDDNDENQTYFQN